MANPKFKVVFCNYSLKQMTTPRMYFVFLLLALLGGGWLWYTLGYLDRELNVYEWAISVLLGVAIVGATGFVAVISYTKWHGRRKVQNSRVQDGDEKGLNRLLSQSNTGRDAKVQVNDEGDEIEQEFELPAASYPKKQQGVNVADMKTGFINYVQKLGDLPQERKDEIISEYNRLVHSWDQHVAYLDWLMEGSIATREEFLEFLDVKEQMKDAIRERLTPSEGKDLIHEIDLTHTRKDLKELMESWEFM